MQHQKRTWWAAPWLGGARFRIGLGFSMLALVLFGAVGFLSSHDARRQSERDTALVLQQLADRLAQRLDSDMAARYRDVDQLAKLTELMALDMKPERWRQVIDRLHSSSQHYSWIGVADLNGRVLAATDGLLEHANVHDRPWFTKGLKQTSVSDVHDAKLLAALMPAPASGDPMRFVDVSAPIQIRGQTVGVIGAHLSWAWADERRREALADVAGRRDIEILLIGRDGRIELGPQIPSLVDTSNSGLNALLQAAQVVNWSDGRRYLTAVRASRPMVDYPGMGWMVVVRQSESSAMSAAMALERRLLWFSGLGALAFGVLGWLLADRLTQPLRQVAAQAQAMMQPGKCINVHDEVDQLASSLATLLAELEDRERTMKAMNEQLETRVAERTASLRMANEDLRGFSASISHDLQGPLGSMVVLLRHTLSNKAGDMSEPTAHIMTVVANECDRLRELTSELLTLAMVDQREVVQQPIDHNSLVQEVVEQLHRASLHAFPTVDIGPLPTLPGDLIMLRQVWTNLLANAVKFSSKVTSPHIQVNADVLGGEVQFVVADNGAGFDEARRERLFGMFQRLHHASDFPGTGVGLSIVRRVVQRHGGRIWAESPPGSGARFYFVLPKAERST
jgi:signal transduction histidine kinase